MEEQPPVASIEDSSNSGRTFLAILVKPGVRHGRIFFWTRFENSVAKRRKINDRVAPILEAIRN